MSLISLFFPSNSYDFYLVGNKIGNDGAKFIREAMKENKIISTLEIGCMCFYFFLPCLISSLSLV